MRGVANSASTSSNSSRITSYRRARLAEDFKQFADVLRKTFELVADFVAAERGQAMEAKLEDRLHLRFGELVASRAWPAARPLRRAAM